MVLLEQELAFELYRRCDQCFRRGVPGHTYTGLCARSFAHDKLLGRLDCSIEFKLLQRQSGSAALRPNIKLVICGLLQDCV